MTKKIKPTIQATLRPFFLVMILLPLLAHSADWVVAPGIAVEQIFTDNAHLDDTQEHESITSLKPRISLYRKAARSTVDIRYAPQYRHYWQETESNKLVQFLQAEGDIELVENHFFIDGWATADQHTLDSSSRTGVDSVTGSDELTQVYTAGISPYLVSQLGAYVSMEARYGINRVEYSEETADSSTGHRADLVLGSGRSIKTLPWELHLEKSIVDYDDLQEDDEVTRARAEVAYQLNRQWALAAAMGYEKYELALNQDNDGEIWSVGFIYTPSSRSRLAAGFGERSFGDDYYLDFSHRSQRIVWTAGYQRDFVSARDEVLRPTLFDRQDAFGNLIRDPVLTNPVRATRSGPTLDEGFYLLEAFNTKVVFSAARTSLALSAAYIEREYEEVLLINDSTETNLIGQFTRKLRPRLSGNLGLRWTDHQEEGADYDQWTLSVGGNYQVGPKTTLSVRLSHLERDADAVDSSYTENRASVRLDKRW
ncbi:MAG: TIGR03016 family PEP-CTERM system-associated outer membrane protein [Gammaproteobacteria bacterium]|nr:TIGR03016 family PEP-CTERM system-associated outer membrane protein [Gammaproteobacteria bacterium]